MWRVACFSLAVALAAAASGLIGRAGAAGDKALGQYLSSECVTCHQLSGANVGIPPIIGWPEDSFIEIMNEYRQKKRTNPIMQTIAGRFSNDEIAALAAYFGSVKSKGR
jgi:cytochrome c553